MKKISIIAGVLISVFVSCKKEKTEDVVPVASKSEVVDETILDECYMGVLKKDTVSMTLNIKGNQVHSGKLQYKFFEKDKNQGTIVGELKGDTLFVDYTFMSEGISSVRQIAFLKKGNTYTEGYGNVIDDNGKVRFENTKELKFDGETILWRIDCQK